MRLARTRTLSAIAAATACVALCAPTRAQSINIDISSLSGTPSSSYGAAAGQTGVWNGVPGGAQGTVFDLVDLAGASTGAKLRYSSTLPQCGYDFAAGSIPGDDGALLDDYHRVDSCMELVVAVTGLTPGTYDLYTYAYPASDPLNTQSMVAAYGGLGGVQIVGGQGWSGSHVQGVTYALDTVAPDAAGTVGVILRPFGISTHIPLNGLQLVLRDPVVTYCTSKINSCGQAPTMWATGLPTLTANPGDEFTVSWGPVPNDPDPQKKNFGIMIETTNGPLAVPFQHPKGYGWLCITTGVGMYRVTPPQKPTGNFLCDGVYTFDFGSWMIAGNDPNILSLVSTVGAAQVDAQGWYRDPPSLGGANLTGAIQFVVIP